MLEYGTAYIHDTLIGVKSEKKFSEVECDKKIVKGALWAEGYSPTNFGRS